MLAGICLLRAFNWTVFSMLNVHDSDSISDERNNIHTPHAQWFTTENITTNNITDNLGESSNLNLLSNDLLEDKCFVDKQSATDTIKASHIRDSRNYCVMKSDSTHKWLPIKY